MPCDHQPTLTCCLFGCHQPNQTPQQVSPPFASRSASSHHDTSLANQPSSPLVPLWPPSLLPLPGPQLCNVQRCSLVALPAWLLRALSSRLPIDNPFHQCVVEPIPTLAAINTPARLGNPLPLAKHVSSLQGTPRGGGECHPLALPDRMPTSKNDIIDPDTRFLFGTPCHQRSQPLSSIPPSLRAARGTQLNNLCSPVRDLFRGRMATQHDLPHHRHRHPHHASLFSPPPGRRVLRRALTIVHQQAVIRVTYMSKHWSKPALWNPGVSSAGATAQVLRFSAMIIGPSCTEHHLSSRSGAPRPHLTSTHQRESGRGGRHGMELCLDLVEFSSSGVPVPLLLLLLRLSK